MIALGIIVWRSKKKASLKMRTIFFHFWEGVLWKILRALLTSL